MTNQYPHQMVNEHWKPISEYTGYFVSDLGNIKSEKGRKPKMLNGRLDKDGYRMLTTKMKSSLKTKQKILNGAMLNITTTMEQDYLVL